MKKLPINQYNAEITETAKDDDATEHSFRTSLENLLKDLIKQSNLGGNTTVLQEPAQNKHKTPDFLIKSDNGIIGYLECKRPDTKLEPLINAKQLQSYANLSSNIVLTDYFRFILLRNGEIHRQADLQTDPPDVVQLLQQFLSSEARRIKNAENLAKIIAPPCRSLRAKLKDELANDTSSLKGLKEEYRKLIYKNMEDEQFADVLAQTLAYNLIMAKLNAPAGELLDLYNIESHIPQHFALTRELTGYLKQLQRGSAKPVVDFIIGIVNSMDVDAIKNSLSYNSNNTNPEHDPYIYFYENFLKAYDPELREQRGVYYTPLPVVRFIVRAVEHILRREFNLTDGLADAKVTALDFATGSGTFLLEMMRNVLSGKGEAQIDSLAREHLLKNFFGFEFLVAPYTIAHLKLAQFLADNGVPLREEERIQVYLTNTLDDPTKAQAGLSLLPYLSAEFEQASAIKNKQKIFVIIGNPPYSGISQNKGKWITAEINKNYKFVDGEPLNEKNPKSLQDDYVKFIRFAQWKMEQVDEGIIAIITNHAFLDNLTFRGMRQSLLKSFDRLYFLDLHGNAKREEKPPEGGEDQNVFDIQQGVAISLFIKNPNLKKGVFHADLWGDRSKKYKWCEEQTIETVNWKESRPFSPFYLFDGHKREKKTMTEYYKFPSIKEIFSAKTSGIATARDHLCIHHTDEELLTAISKFADLSIPDDEIRRDYSVKDTYQWEITHQRKLFSEKEITHALLHTIHYRPFDARRIYYDDIIVSRRRFQVMRHLLEQDNLGLVTVRQSRSSDSWRHVFITDKLMEGCYISNKSSEGNYIYPLYRTERDLQTGKPARIENLSANFRNWMDELYGKRYAPEQILGYIYAVMHSPDYRSRYREFLRIDYPRIPFTPEPAEFERLAALGNDLIQTHLLRANTAGATEHCGTGKTHKVTKVEHKDEKLYFNPDEYFAPITSAVYEHQIGGYKPLKKYLESRKNRQLTLAEITTLKHAANAIAHTQKLTSQIGLVLPPPPVKITPFEPIHEFPHFVYFKYQMFCIIAAYFLKYAQTYACMQTSTKLLCCITNSVDGKERVR